MTANRMRAASSIWASKIRTVPSATFLAYAKTSARKSASSQVILWKFKSSRSFNDGMAALYTNQRKNMKNTAGQKVCSVFLYKDSPACTTRFRLSAGTILFSFRRKGMAKIRPPVFLSFLPVPSSAAPPHRSAAEWHRALRLKKPERSIRFPAPFAR